MASRQGVDPRQLAAQLEGIREAASPAENSPSSSHQDVATPSVSSPCSTPRSDPTSTSSDRQQHPSSGSADKSEKVCWLCLNFSFPYLFLEAFVLIIPVNQVRSDYPVVVFLP